MTDPRRARVEYLRAVLSALGDELLASSSLTLNSRLRANGSLEVVFTLPDAGAFNALVTKHAEAAVLTNGTDAAGD
ncbi:MAG: hypothetical protein AB7F65_06780 [Dehalococcoidia bacterium]